jgi:hypothetical protein
VMAMAYATSPASMPGRWWIARGEIHPGRTYFELKDIV